MAFQKNKKVKTTHEGDDKEFREFLNAINQERQTHPSVREFKFNVKRVRIMTDVKLMPVWSKGILYWMTREMRVQDNWSFLYAQKLALERQLPLHVCFSQKKKFLDSTIRNFRFMLKGLEEVSEECKKLDIPFHMLLSDPTEKTLIEFISENKFGCVVTDFHPLRIITGWIDELKKGLPEDVTLHQVDGHNIVPCWEASDKLEYGARTIRNKINDRLRDYLSTFPPLIKHPHTGTLKAEEIDWSKVESFLEVDRTVADADWALPGYMSGIKVLYDFIKKRLIKFSSKRNDPLGDALSNLSPWFHFGQISVQRCILEVSKYKHKYKASVEAFCEEAIVRRELADNFCFYNPNYDKLEGAYDWAKKTLDLHKKDKRVYLYTREELEEGLTHDDLWNSAQIQLVKEAKMHGFLRMYWAKKILEWTATPEEALATAIWLNDKYNLDGRDPNGYVGCMWSICGIHDQGWKERDIFGKIRYMNYEGCKKKFDVSAFVARYGGKVHKKK